MAHSIHADQEKAIAQEQAGPQISGHRPSPWLAGDRLGTPRRG
jgi:hypothetical protein